MFISWVRDHIHTMKAYKYWEKDLASYIAFFMGRQTGTGMAVGCRNPERKVYL